MKKILSFKTKNDAQTRRIAEIFGREILNLKTSKSIVLGLEGNLGAGKTTFTKGFAKGLGIKEEMKSPTFILMRAFKIHSLKTSKKHFLHFDAYRIDRADEFRSLGFKEMAEDQSNIMLIEWSDKIKKIMPKNYFLFRFRHLGKNNRQITFWN